MYASVLVYGIYQLAKLSAVVSYFFKSNFANSVYRTITTILGLICKFSILPTCELVKKYLVLRYLSIGVGRYHTSSKFQEFSYSNHNDWQSSRACKSHQVGVSQVCKRPGVNHFVLFVVIAYQRLRVPQGSIYIG